MVKKNSNKGMSKIEKVISGIVIAGLSICTTCQLYEMFVKPKIEEYNIHKAAMDEAEYAQMMLSLGGLREFYNEKKEFSQ
jgi:hypothetical protein